METVRKIQNNFYTIIYKNSDIYQGEVIKSNDLKNIIPHGYGKYYSKDINYAGHWENGLKHGNGILTTKNERSTIYAGEFKKDKRHGICLEKYYINDKIKVFEGSYFNDLKHGSAVEYTENNLHPELVKKFDIKYNMGFTNSLKEFNFTKNNFTIQGFTHNNNKIGPVIITKIIKNKEYIYKGDYNNQISGQGVLEVNVKQNLKTIFNGTFKPVIESNNHSKLSAYEFDGTVESINYSVNSSEELQYSIFPEFYKLIRYNYINSYKIIFTGKFLIKFKPYSLETDLTMLSSFTFKCYDLKKNKNINKLILSGKKNLKHNFNVDNHISEVNKSFEKLKITDDISSKNSSSESDSSSYSDSSSESDYDWSDESDYDECLYPTLIKEVKKKQKVDVTSAAEIQKINNYFVEKIKLLAEEKNDVIMNKLENFNIIEYITDFDKNLNIDLNITANFHDEMNEITTFDKYPGLYFGSKYYFEKEEKKLINIGIYTNNFSLYRNSQDSILFRLSFRNNRINYLQIFISDTKQFLITFLNENDNLYLEYKGESKNFEKYGKGIEYYNNNNIKYDGEFRWNIPHGIGSLYDISGGLIFTGNFLDGAPALD